MHAPLIRQVKIAILALQDAAPTTIIGPQDVFSMAGVLYEMIQGKPPVPYFSVRIVTQDGLPVTCYNNLVITPHSRMEEWDADIIIVPGILNVDETLRRSTTVFDWLRSEYERGTLLTSICSGSLLLAAAGLLDGKTATTHWAMVNLFRALFPDVLLKPAQLITEDSGIICSGGFNSYLDTSIYVINKFCGSQVAVECSKIFLHDNNCRSQAPYFIFKGCRDHGDEQIFRVQDILEKNYADDIDFNALARELGMGRRTLERHFKKATGETLLAYLQQIRVEHAKRLLETGNAGVDEICYLVGYKGTSFFRKLFIKYTSITPGEYRNRFSNTAFL